MPNAQSSRPFRITSPEFKRILDRVERLNRQEKLIQKKDFILLGFSGGPDSTVLMAVLSALARKYSLRLAAAHLHHGLRSRTADRDLRFCLKTAPRFGFSFFFEKEDVRALSRKKKISLEDAGRMARYDYFVRLARRLGANKVATAHTLDDQAETVLMRILRGTGLRGISGIPARRRLGRVVLIRPLLGCPKKELLNVLRTQRMGFVSDETNLRGNFTRNRIRKELLPIMEKYNPSARQALCNLAEMGSVMWTYLEPRAEQAFRRCVLEEKKGHVKLNSKKLCALPSVLLREVLQKAYEQALGIFGRAAYIPVSLIEGFVRSGESKEAHLPEVRVLQKNGVLVFAKQAKKG